MGTIANSFAAYAQPLLDKTDGSPEQMNTAFAFSQLCWNLALLPENERDKALNEIRPTLHMDDDTFDDFRRSIVLPMIRRHEEMFPQMRGRKTIVSLNSGPSPLPPSQPEKYPGTKRNAPCPCYSGLKYKRCCGPRRVKLMGG